MSLLLNKGEVMVRRSSILAASIAIVFALVLPAPASAQQQFGWVAAPSAAAALGGGDWGGGADAILHVTLADGRVLAAGGFGSTASAILDGSGHWTPTGNMVRNRVYSTPVRLHDGRILAIGGHEYVNYGGYLYILQQPADAELYDPATGEWSLVNGEMSTRRSHARAVVVKDGRVLVVGGFLLTGGGWYPYQDVPLSAVDIFDPATNSWAPAASMSNWHSAYRTNPFQVFLLGDGRVVAWDYAQWGSQFPEIYNPATNSWDWFWGAVNGTPVALPDGRLMLIVAGSDYGGAQTATRIFDPVANAWSDGPPVPQFRTHDQLIPLPDGKVLMAGGAFYEEETDEYEGSSYTYWAARYGTTWIFDASRNAWSQGPAWTLTSGRTLNDLSYEFTVTLPMAQGRMFHSAGAIYRPVTPPVAVSPNLTLGGTTGVLGLYSLDASGSYDPSGDALIDFTWKSGDTVLSSGPSAVQQFLLGVGTHALTLTVTDATHLKNTVTVTIVIQDAAAAAWSAYESCTANVTALESSLAAANATIATLQAELARLQQQIASLSQGQQKALEGKKK